MKHKDYFAVAGQTDRHAGKNGTTQKTALEYYLPPSTRPSTTKYPYFYYAFFFINL